MLNTNLQSTFAHLRARSMERPVSAVGAKPANSTPCLDDYEVLCNLGKGANATVYLVREKNTRHLYALKAVDKFTEAGRKVACSTVLNEQAALTKLSGSEFILPLHACFHDTEYWYLVTEYLPGGDLQDLLCTMESLDVEAIRFYMAELLLAIEDIHAHNIIHRDIKQENVFIDTDGHIVLGDFGVAWLFSDFAPETHLTHGRVGTPAFSSPEVLFDHEYGFEADLWAFGVMLYEMLSDREAFKTDTVLPDDPTWLRHLSEHIKCDEPVIVESPSMTEDAADLVSQLLRKDRNSRLSDITEIKKHPFFGAIDWARISSRSLTPPWVPHISTRQVWVQPIICSGDEYTAGYDPLPSFTFRAASSSLSRVCGRRQQVFGVLEGCAPLVTWVDGSNYVEEVVSQAPPRQRSLKTVSRWVMKSWVMRALSHPVRSA
ncbi:Protein kinase-like domain containing protein [Russula decolorans]